MKTIFITNCSVTRAVGPVATLEQMPYNLTMDSAMKSWWGMITQDVEKFTPAEIYRGGGFTEAVGLVQKHSLDELYIVTGGQGLISSETEIVPYDFSGSKNEESNIHKHVTAGPFIAHRWWAEINKRRHGTETPISELVQRDDIDTVLIACTKIFLKYIERDLLNIPAEMRHKVKIFIPQSSQGSVAKQLRPMMYPYSRQMIAHLPGNRNNSTQRAAALWFETKERLASDAEVQDYFVKTAGQESSGETNRIDLTELFSKHPELGEMTPDEAYAAAKSLGNVGGVLVFKGAFREHFNLKQVIDKSEQQSALNVLDSLNLQPAAQVTTDVEEEETLRLLTLLATSLRDAGNDVQLTTAQVCAWGVAYCQQQGIKQPKYFDSSAKLARLLSSNAKVAGFKEISSPTVSSKRYQAV